MLCGIADGITPLQQERLYNDYQSGQYTAAELMELYPLKRSALYATIKREREHRELADLTASIAD